MSEPITPATVFIDPLTGRSLTATQLRLAGEMLLSHADLLGRNAGNDWTFPDDLSEAEVRDCLFQLGCDNTGKLDGSDTLWEEGPWKGQVCGTGGHTNVKENLQKRASQDYRIASWLGRILLRLAAAQPPDGTPQGQ